MKKRGLITTQKEEEVHREDNMPIGILFLEEEAEEANQSVLSVEILDTNILNVPIGKYMEEEKITFHKCKGEMLRWKMQKVEDP
jgi:hypothetical protein